MTDRAGSSGYPAAPAGQGAALRAAPLRRLWSLPRAVEHLRFWVADLAGFAGKSVCLVIDVPPLMLPQPTIAALVPELVAALRETVAAAIETPGERLAAGKPLTATLILRAAVAGRSLAVAIDHDGRAAGRAGRRPGCNSTAAASTHVGR